MRINQLKFVLLFIGVLIAMLMINVIFSVQFAMRYKQVVSQYLQEYRESETLSTLEELEQKSESMHLQFRMLLIAASLTSVVLCTVMGFFIVQRLSGGGSGGIALMFMQREVKFARDKLDNVLKMLEKQPDADQQAPEKQR